MSRGVRALRTIASTWERSRRDSSWRIAVSLHLDHEPRVFDVEVDSDGQGPSTHASRGGSRPTSEAALGFPRRAPAAQSHCRAGRAHPGSPWPCGWPPPSGARRLLRVSVLRRPTPQRPRRRLPIFTRQVRKAAYSPASAIGRRRRGGGVLFFDSVSSATICRASAHGSGSSAAVPPPGVGASEAGVEKFRAGAPRSSSRRPSHGGRRRRRRRG
jgi:hypothetical protein